MRLPCSLDKVPKVEIEEIVALDDVWIDLMDERCQGVDKLRFGRLVATQDGNALAVDTQGDQYHPRVRERRIEAQGFDIELQSDELLEVHTSEQPSPGVDQVL